MADELEELVGSSSFQHWFRDRASIEISGDQVIIGVKHQFLLSWMQHRFRPAVLEAARRTLGDSADVRFEPRPAGPEGPIGEAASASASPPAAPAAVLQRTDLKSLAAHPSAMPVAASAFAPALASVRPAAIGPFAEGGQKVEGHPTARTVRMPPAQSSSPTHSAPSQTAPSQTAPSHSLPTQSRASERSGAPQGGNADPGARPVAGAKSLSGAKNGASVCRERRPPSASSSSGAAAQSGRRFADLGDFVRGECNEIALTAALHVCEVPGTRYNPLVIYGGVGTGKTHLLEGTYRRLRARVPTFNLMFLSAETFANSFTQALRDRSMPGFRQRFRSVDVLLVDDVDFLEGKRVIQEEFLHTIRQLESHQRQIVLTCDRHPRLLTRLCEELVTRFISGVVCRIEPPDLETRREIVQRKSARMVTRVSDEALAFVVQRFGTSVRELEGALNCLEAYAIASGKTLGLSAARHVLADLQRDCLRVVRVVDVEQAVCRFFGLAPDDLRSARRSRSYSQPRMLAMFLARKLTQAAYSEIGEHFGGRNHSTVISAEKRVRSMLSDQTDVRIGSQTWRLGDLMQSIETQLLTG